MSVYRFISAEKARTPVSLACGWLGVSRSGYYEWATRLPSDGGHGNLPVGGHRKSPLAAIGSPHGWPSDLPTVLVLIGL